MSATCKSCGAPIVWAVSENGKKHPLDAAVNERGNVWRFTLPNDTELRCTFRPLTTAEPCTSHFATCPDAKKWGKS